MEFNSLDAQREACEAYISSQKSEGWVATRDRYDVGGFSGGNLDRTGLKQLLADIDDGLIDVVVVYKIDRLSRALMDFSKLVEVFDRNGVTFVSVTQSFNTTNHGVERVTSSDATQWPLIRWRPVREWAGSLGIDQTSEWGKGAGAHQFQRRHGWSCCN